MNIYQLKITLKHIRPAIWRRIQAAGNTKLGKLHDILQTVMGWEDCHLHQFTIDGVHYGTPDPDYPSDINNERNVRLDQIAKQGDTLIYEYDFGDSWEHTLKIEKVFESKTPAMHPVCMDGARACPLEDCGGFPGYQHLLRILRNPKHKEYEDMLDWTGEDFDPEAFDLVEINKAPWRLR